MQTALCVNRDMGAHTQAWARSLAPWKCCRVFCALVVTAKRSSDELLMRYFHSLSYDGGFASRPGLHLWTPLGAFVPRPLICTPLEKICGRPCANTEQIMSICTPYKVYVSASNTVSSTVDNYAD